MHPRFRVQDGGDGLVVSDPITRRQYPLGTDAGIDPEPVAPGQFLFPVSTAIAIETAEIRLPTVVATFVRDAAGEVVARCEYDSSVAFPEGEYVLDIHPPVKLYVLASGPFTVRTTKEDRTIEFPEPTRVRIGARSFHHRPAATVTATEDPADVMAAISTFGSALKTTSPERSFPTLRGHPPLVELGDELVIPDELDVPETGVHIELPPEMAYVLPAASLAFYLGADVVPGSRPSLVTDDGFVHDLAPDDDFQSEIERTLQQIFLFDCVTRTEGLYPVDLHERRLLEERLDLDLVGLYDAPLAERVERYLAVEFEDVADLVPTWRLAVDCRTEAAVVEYLSYAANDLGFVRPFEPDPPVDAPEMVASVEEFTRNADGPPRDGGDATRDDDPARSGGKTSVDADEEPFVQVRSRDTLEAVWAGEGHPLQGGKLMRAGYDNVFDREPVEGEIEVAVVCNDEEMVQEYEDQDLYGDLKSLPFEVRQFVDLSVEELRAVLESRYDFLHYIGHLEDDAFVCTDGDLSVRELDAVGPFAFLLNGCQSYHQGVEMVGRGSAGGIVTNNDVGNRGAITVGQHLARLLNRGFSIQSALNLVQDVELVGNGYVTVGASNHPIVQIENVPPAVYHLHEATDGSDGDEGGDGFDGDAGSGDGDGDAGSGGYEITMSMYPSTFIGMGSVISPYVGDDPPFYLTPGQVRVPGVVPADELTRRIATERMPIIYEGRIKWISEVEL